MKIAKTWKNFIRWLNGSPDRDLICGCFVELDGSDWIIWGACKTHEEEYDQHYFLKRRYHEST